MKVLRTSANGTLVMDKPAPLDSASMEIVFDQLTQHPNYQDQVVIGYDSEGKKVELK